MLSLKDAARTFDSQTFSDLHGVSPDFSGKILPFSDSTRSGPSTQRRILDTGPDSIIPVEREVSTSGVTFIVGNPNKDFFSGDVIRVKYPVLPIDSQFYIRTVAQVLSDSGGTLSVYMAPMYIRRVIFEDKSEYTGGYIMYASPYYRPSPGDIMSDGTEYFVARERGRADEAGFGATEITEVINPLQNMDIVIQSGAYDPVTDTYTKVTTPGVLVFVEHYSLDFNNTSLGFEKIEAGDQAISMLKAVIPSISSGDNVGDYTVLAVRDRGDFWTIHGRA